MKYEEMTMTVKADKIYARISDYGDIMVPLALFEKMASEGFIVRTSYENGDDVISEIGEIKKVNIHKGQEIVDALAQKALQGD